MKKGDLILIIGVILVIIIIVFLLNFRENNTSLSNNKMNNISKGNGISIQKNQDIDEDRELLKEILNYCEQEYNKIKKYSYIYKREDIYNENIIVKEYDGVSIEFIAEKNINYDNLYDINYKKLNEIHEFLYHNNLVEIESNRKLIPGKYYLIEFERSENRYNEYFISKLTDDGFENVEFYSLLAQDEAYIEM